jgi:hypothetical protein
MSFRWLLSDGESTTRCITERGSQERVRHLQWLPEACGRADCRQRWCRRALGDDIGDVLLRIRTSHRCQRVRRWEGRSLGGRGRAQAHWRRRISSRKAAGRRVFRRAIRRLEEIFAREKKRRRGRSDGAIYSRGWRARGARVLALGEIDGAGSSRARARLRPEVEGDPDRWGPPISGRKGEGDTLSGWDGIGPGRLQRLGRFGPPGLFYIFLWFSLFPFLFFPISFISFENLIQIQSNNFLSYYNIQGNILNQ